MVSSMAFYQIYECDIWDAQQDISITYVVWEAENGTGLNSNQTFPSYDRTDTTLMTGRNYV
jgi:hypothetical protein